MGKKIKLFGRCDFPLTFHFGFLCFLSRCHIRALLVGGGKARGAEVSALMTLSANTQGIKMYGKKVIK
jgi:hypothetical protein